MPHVCDDQVSLLLRLFRMQSGLLASRSSANLRLNCPSGSVFVPEGERKDEDEDFYFARKEVQSSTCHRELDIQSRSEQSVLLLLL